MTKTITFRWKAIKNLVFIVILLLFFVLGFWIRGHWTKTGPETAAAAEEQEQTIWTCSMHPQIRQPKAGKCPICYMDLVPVAQTQVGPRQVEYTDEALKLMEVRTTPAQRKFVEVQVHMVGKVHYDESRIKNIAAWAPGRIDRLFVDYVGIRVEQGDHMVELYSPELISAQAELLQSLQSAQQIDAGSSLISQSVRETLQAARDKLRLLGVKPEQIETIEQTGRVMDHLTIYAPIGGVVIEKRANEGGYVNTGQMIYTVADLSKVWLRLDAYESDLPWIRYGQEVEFIAAAYPGEIFKGTISFIDPFLNPKTRTVKLRVNADNPDGKLKPEMFVRAAVHVRPAADGRVASPQMAGKWICPMHPDVVKDKAGACDLCGMDLVTAESLGLDTAVPQEPPLVIPASAPLVTGSRAVVYIRVPDTEVPTFEGRQIVLGSRAGDYYMVKSGLEEGEIVVTKGSFKIDADLQIQARPSMMSPEGGAVPAGHEGH